MVVQILINTYKEVTRVWMQHSFFLQNIHRRLLRFMREITKTLMDYGIAEYVERQDRKR